MVTVRMLSTLPRKVSHIHFFCSHFQHKRFHWTSTRLLLAIVCNWLPLQKARGGVTQKQLGPKINPGEVLPSFPPHLSNPLGPFHNIFPLHQSFYAKQLSRQFFIACNPMNETVTGPTQPCHFVQFPFLMPTSLHGLVVHLSRNEMVVGQR